MMKTELLTISDVEAKVFASLPLPPKILKKASASLPLPLLFTVVLTPQANRLETHKVNIYWPLCPLYKSD